MKKIMYIFITMFMIFNFSLTNSNAEPKFNSSKDISIYMRNNFTYTLDKVVKSYFDYFQTPAVLEFSKMGDCDDFATYSWYYLSKLNIPAQRYVFWGIDSNTKEEYGHAITVFLEKDKTYSIFSNQYIIFTKKTDPIEAIKDVYTSWTIICEWNPTKYGLVTYQEFLLGAELVGAKNSKMYVKWLKMQHLKNKKKGVIISYGY